MNANSKRRHISVLQALSLVFIYAAVCLAQEPQVSGINAPPPLKTIPKEERTQIESADPKQRVRLTIEFSTQHLGLAERYTEQASYEKASAEVGCYHALIENVLKFLASQKRDSNKTRDLYKRLELALREQGPRLTAMRRTTPLEFAIWIKNAEDFAREGRTEALNSFYGRTVVHDGQSSDEDKRAAKPKDESAPKSRTP